MDEEQSPIRHVRKRNHASAGPRFSWQDGTVTQRDNSAAIEAPSYPRLAARTRHFQYGQPRTVSVSPNGQRVVFLRSDGPEDPAHRLWVFEVATGKERLIADPAALLGLDSEDLPPEERAMRERRRESSGGVVAYATDEQAEIAVFALSGRLFRADLITGDVTELPVSGPVIDPRPDPAGHRIAYVTGGALHVLDTDDDGVVDRVLAEEEDITWGLAEFIAAEEMNRFRGYWWSPDGRRILAARVDEAPVPRWYISDPASPDTPSTEISYPHAGGHNADVSLHLISLDTRERTEINWDRDEFPYLVTAGWDQRGHVLATVMNRAQSTASVFGADPSNSTVTEYHRAEKQPWLEIMPGTPALVGDDHLLFSVDSPDGTSRQLTMDGEPITPEGLYVRGYLGRLGSDANADLLIEATEDEPEANHVYRVSFGEAHSVTRLTTEDGWHGVVSGGSTMVVISRSLDKHGVTFSVRAAGRTQTLESLAARPELNPTPALARVTERRLPTGVLYPNGHRRGEKLPVLMDPYGGPHHQEVIAARNLWYEPQWWADQGFAVVVVDGRGTPGVSPGFEAAIRDDLASPVLDDQVDALLALAADHPDFDMSRVGIRGWSFGGYLAALAVLRRPDIFSAAVAGAPVTDWSLYDTFYTERYLGLPTERPDVYANSSLIADAGKLTKPLMIIHGLADDNVVAAHTLRLSSALLAAGRPHEVLPLTGVTHMASGEIVAENLLLLQRDFLRRHLA